MVKLVKYSLEYLPEFIKIRNNENIYKNGFDATPNPFTNEFAKDIFDKQIEKIPAERFLITFNGYLCGEIGIWLREDIFRLNADIGYFVAESYWGNGIATEAIKLMTNYVFETFTVIRIVASVFEFNKSSMRALAKNGYLLESVQRNGAIKIDLIVDNYIWVKFKNS